VRTCRLGLSMVASLAVAALVACPGCERKDSPGGAPAPVEVPRNRTMVLDCPDSGIGTGQWADCDSFNPFVPGAISRTGYNFLYEPLYFYNVYRDELIPWIAEGHEFDAAFTRVTVRIRPGVAWSDGRPWTAEDLAFTINMLRDNAPFLSNSIDMKTCVQQARALDERTAQIDLNAPNPRFVFTYFTSYFCSGVPVVPRHVWEGRDPRQFANLDRARGWPVVSGPYRLALSTPQQKVWDLRRDWWAATTGFRPLPKVERIVYLTYLGETQRVENLIAGRLDSSLELRPANMKALLDACPSVSTWTGRQKPWGYLDHWPVSLGFNALEAPFSDPAFRRAVSFAIDRAQLVEVGWRGAGASTLVPFPEFPPMQRFVDAARDLFETHAHGVYDLARSAEVMARAGWAKDADGFWARDGARASFEINGYVFIFQDIGPVLAEQLRRAGFDATYREARDCYNRMATGQARSYLCGISASVRDPFATMLDFHGRYVRPTGTATAKFWRWQNAAYDDLVDAMASVPSESPEFLDLYRRAMDVWLRELPAIPLVAWHQRVPHNETYWKGWPTAEDPYCNSAYWHRMWLQVLLRLEPTQP
jgi:peptide/nickel transport system substrate-binding protein